MNRTEAKDLSRRIEREGSGYAACWIATDDGRNWVVIAIPHEGWREDEWYFTVESWEMRDVREEVMS